MIVSYIPKFNCFILTGRHSLFLRDFYYDNLHYHFLFVFKKYYGTLLLSITEVHNLGHSLKQSHVIKARMLSYRIDTKIRANFKGSEIDGLPVVIYMRVEASPTFSSLDLTNSPITTHQHPIQLYFHIYPPDRRMKLNSFKALSTPEWAILPSDDFVSVALLTYKSDAWVIANTLLRILASSQHRTERNMLDQIDIVLTKFWDHEIELNLLE
ncbi:hypothetical protein GQR58_026206 [Nymphon striatum]|nr:hypothetical protein GQR58_026206 [Nymphon striatum]